MYTSVHALQSVSFMAYSFFYISLQIQIDELEVIIILCVLLNRS